MGKTNISKAGPTNIFARAPVQAAVDASAPLLMQALKFHQQGHLTQAQALYDSVMQMDPSNFDALHLRGVLENDRKNSKLAVHFLEKALSIRPRSVAACQNLGIALRHLKRLEEALDIYGRALQIEPHNPELLNNRGNVFLELGMWIEALSDYERALSLAPDFVEAYDNQGNALRELHRFEEALASYARAQALMPDFASAHWNESLCRLLMGDLEEGWKKYEWGWPVGIRGQVRKFSQPLWLGQERIAGRTILLHAEQGFGDTIHFSRYAREVAAQGARVVLEVQPALKALMHKLVGSEQVIAAGAPLPSFDCHCPLASLPLALRSNASTIPARSAYLSADPDLVDIWSAKLGEHNALRVGIAWSGNPQHSRNRQRSLSLQAMLNLRCEGIQLFSLQKDLDGDDVATFEQDKDMQHFGEDFANTAALASLMDIVISVDTSIAHLAAALGRPTWILLMHTPDWRWMLDRDDSPWYPTARLFRQQAPNDWDSALRPVREALAGMSHSFKHPS